MCGMGEGSPAPLRSLTIPRTGFIYLFIFGQGETLCIRQELNVVGFPSDYYICLNFCVKIYYNVVLKIYVSFFIHVHYFLL